MNRNEKYEIAVQRYRQGVITYLAGFNHYGNRQCLTVNHPKKIYMMTGSNHGEYGTVYEDCRVREIKQLEKELVAEGYEHVRTHFFNNYGGLMSINTGEICPFCQREITDEDYDYTTMVECNGCRTLCCTDCATLVEGACECPDCHH